MGLTGWSNGLWTFFGKVWNRSASPKLSLWLCVLLNFLSALATAAQTDSATESVPHNAYSGDKACQQCHFAIYESMMMIVGALARPRFFKAIHGFSDDSELFRGGWRLGPGLFF